MVLILFVAAGVALGYRLGTGRRGFLTLAAVSLSAAFVQLGHLATTSQRSGMTMLPIVIGAVVVAGMMLGALARRTSRASNAR